LWDNRLCNESFFKDTHAHWNSLGFFKNIYSSLLLQDIQKVDLLAELKKWIAKQKKIGA
jgi:hypothetical protein